MEDNNQLAKFNNKQILDIISGIPNLTDEDRHKLAVQIASDDVEIRKEAISKMVDSNQAYEDLNRILGELSALRKEGLYMTGKKTMKTGSGTFEFEVKGGDTRLIIPVLVVIGIVAIAALAIIFWT